MVKLDFSQIPKIQSEQKNNQNDFDHVSGSTINHFCIVTSDGRIIPEEEEGCADFLSEQKLV